MGTSQTSLEATMTEIVEGPITATDRVYAFDKIRQVYPRAPSPVRRARARLSAPPHPTESSRATAECTLVLEDGRIVSAGAIGHSVHDAVDELTTRLQKLHVGEFSPEGVVPMGAASRIGRNDARASFGRIAPPAGVGGQVSVYREEEPADDSDRGIAVIDP